MINFGVQTFTVRKKQKKSIREAYLPLINLGIKSFEVARIDFNEKNAGELASLAEEFGIEIVSIQVKPKYVINHTEKIIGFCNAVGCKRVVISMLPFDCILGAEKHFYRFIDSLDALYDIYAKSGITLAYHHHNWEYIRLSNGKTRMAELLSRTSKIKIVHDTYWTARCGIDPSVQIKDLGDRLLGIHLRDLAFAKKGLAVVPHDAAVGDGVVNFEGVLVAAQNVGCQYYVIEQNTDSPYEEIAKSFAYLESIKPLL